MKEIDKDRHRIIFREEHYGPGGKVVFECFSAYSVGTGFKVEEYGRRGVKKRDLFFLLPV
ncbi:MAG TPA: hypothetical protein VH988_32870 [Thermoanaerobaculia bacterium]|jgi:hypothetical protein|nr:hypothetical protein [Thermoanaerobaculia bacterium]